MRIEVLKQYRQELRTFLKVKKKQLGISYRTLADRIGYEESTVRDFINNDNAGERLLNSVARYFLHNNQKTLIIKEEEIEGQFHFLVENASIHGCSLKYILEKTKQLGLRPIDYLELIEGNGKYRVDISENPRFEGLFQQEIIDFRDFIKERSQGFIGRKVISTMFDEFLEMNSSGYFLIYGKPGMGKSALLSSLSLKYDSIHHFINSNRDGKNSSKEVIFSCTLQAIKKYKIPYNEADSTQEISLRALTKLISLQLKDEEKCIILIDGLDELTDFDPMKKDKSTNLMGLPRFLPKGIFFLMSVREISDISLQSPIIESYELHPDSNENQSDIREYIEKRIQNKKIQSFIRRNKSDNSNFLSYMFQQSEGNFMYLHCVLPQIISGYYQVIDFSEVPTGLNAYYEDHWERMKGKDKKAWEIYKLPIIMFLTLSDMSLTLEMIRKYVNLSKDSMVIEILEDWKQFFFRTDVGLEEGGLRIYKLYHQSFKDFLKAKDLVQAEKREYNKFVKEFIMEKQQYITEYDRLIDILKVHEELVARGIIDK